MKSIGRPSKYSTEIVETICCLLAEGRSLRNICKQEDMPSFRTVVRWALDPYLDFWHQYQRARQIQSEVIADEILEIADSLNNVNDIPFVKLKIDARKWAAGRMGINSNAVARIHVDMTHPVGGW